MASLLSIDCLSNLEKTLLYPLYSRSVDAKQENSILNDTFALQIVEKLDYNFSSFEKSLNKLQILGHALRARYFDDEARHFITKYPEGMVVNLGCGLDTRFLRIDTGNIELIDVDLEEVISLRRNLIPNNVRNKLQALSVTDNDFMPRLEALIGERPVIFLAEGLFMYLQLVDVLYLLNAISSRFKIAEVVFEFYSPFMQREMNKHNLLKGMSDPVKWSVKHPDDILRELQGWEMKKIWNFMGEPEINKGVYRILRHIPFVKKTTRIITLVTTRD